MPSTFSVSDEVRAALREAEITTTAPWRVKLVKKLDRKLYTQVNKVLEGAGGAWSRKEAAHVFERDPRELLGLAVETGKAKNVKQELQAFYTPAGVAQKVVELAEIAWPMTVLEPSAGAGALAEEAAAALMSAAPAGTIGQDVRDMVKCYDVDGVAVEKLRALGYRDAEQRDFLQVAPGEELYDRIAMNPPFTRGAALEHVLYAYSFLKPGGILVAVMPGTVTAPSRTARAAVKQAFGELFLSATSARMTDLPPGSFRESGTDVAVHLLRLAKPAEKKRATRVAPSTKLAPAGQDGWASTQIRPDDRVPAPEPKKPKKSSDTSSLTDLLADAPRSDIPW
jgi:16S rRNA G966 N2-methylase RsmD